MIIRKVLKSSEAMANIKVISGYGRDTNICNVDSIYLGSYPQNDVNGVVKEPLEWIVLCKNEDEHKALLISKYVIDVKKLSNGKEYKWSSSDLRKWLNSEFYNNTFSEKEKDQVLCKMELENRSTYVSDEKTNDYVFCLSEEEIGKYFRAAGTGGFYELFDKVKCTEYVKSIFYKTSKDVAFVSEENEYSPYMLRTPVKASKTDKPMYVHSTAGLINDEHTTYFTVFDKNMCGIRPAIWIHY